jgi:nucleoside-diphosphate-sugar epimerase
MAKSVLLFGGNGYTGSRIYQELVDKYEVESVDLNLFGPDLGYSYYGNYRNISLDDWEYIVLLSNHSSVPMAEIAPHQAWENNVEGLREVLSVLKPTQKLIYASSGSVYGTSSEENSEHHINQTPLNQYDLTKIVMDVIANKYITNLYDIIGLRLGTVNGHSRNLRGDLMINKMVKSAIEDKKIVLTNGNYSRAILGINDFARAIDAIIDPQIFIRGQYNLCSFNEEIGVIAHTVAKKLDVPVVDQGSTHGVYDYRLSTNKFRTLYRFEFQDTIDSLVDELIENYSPENFSLREDYRLGELEIL